MVPEDKFVEAWNYFCWSDMRRDRRGLQKKDASIKLDLHVKKILIIINFEPVLTNGIRLLFTLNCYKTELERSNQIEAEDIDRSPKKLKSFSEFDRNS